MLAKTILQLLTLAAMTFATIGATAATVLSVLNDMNADGSFQELYGIAPSAGVLAISVPPA
jgi:hypothetical protein